MAILQPFPSLPTDTLRLDLQWCRQTFPIANVRVCRLSLHFTAVNPLPPGYNPGSDFISKSILWLRAVTVDQWATNLSSPGYNVLLQTVTNQFAAYPVYSPNGTLQGDYVNYSLCSVFTKRNVATGPNWRGRAHFLPVPKSYLSSDGTYSNGGYAKLRQAADAMILPITMNGQAFKPAVFSPQLNGVSPIDHFDVVPSPRILYRRRLNRQHEAQAYFY